MNKEMILSLHTNWMEKNGGDTPEVHEASQKLERFLKANIADSHTALEANNLADYMACEQEEQGFVQGFRCAVALLMGGAVA